MLAVAVCFEIGWMRGRPRPRLTGIAGALCAVGVGDVGSGFLTVGVFSNSLVFFAGFDGTGGAGCLLDLGAGLAADTDSLAGVATFVFNAGFASALVLAAGLALFFPEDGFLETAIGAGSLSGGMTSLRQRWRRALNIRKTCLWSTGSSTLSVTSENDRWPAG